jgi:hypothetical protein
MIKLMIKSKKTTVNTIKPTRARRLHSSLLEVRTSSRLDRDGSDSYFEECEQCEMLLRRRLEPASAPAETFGSARAPEQHLDTTEEHLDIMGEEWSKSSCAASVNNRPAFSPCFLTRNESDLLRCLSIILFILWHVFTTPLEKRSIEAKDSSEKVRMKPRGLSAAEIGVEASG